MYRARPAGAPPSGTVIVGFEMFGLTRYIRAVTERIATLGYTTLAPDFYHRSGAAEDRGARHTDAAADRRGRPPL